MSGNKADHKHGISGSVAHGACPICYPSAPADQLIEEDGVRGAGHLCNQHAWSLARSAPAALAAEIFLQSLYVRQQEGLQGMPAGCDFCEALRSEEAGELKALAEKMEDPSFLEWMRTRWDLMPSPCQQDCG